MATTTTTPPRPVNDAAAKAALIAQANAYLRMEEQSEARIVALATQREAESDKLFTTLSAALDLTKLAALWKACETATTAIDVEAVLVASFQKALAKRMAGFSKANTATFRLALEQRLRELTEQQTREQKDVGAVKSRVKTIEKRLKELDSTAAKTARARKTKKS